MTFSIAARCPRTGMFGLAISSSSPAVAARCAHARAGVGVVATQNVTDPTLGPLGLDLMARGASAEQARDILVATRPHIDHRQLVLVDASGRTAIFCGHHMLGIHATAEGEGVAAAGNLLADAGVPQAMIDRFRTTGGELADQLLAAMKAALAAGGEAGPVHSAGLLLVRDVPWPIADLRVDWTDADPIEGLERLWALYRPQLDAYIDRALDPGRAPSYGVPGDE
jgi:uncharacterized Ntn-hydrolase superfamily protein